MSRYLLLLLIIHMLSGEEHKIVYLISGPRALSTVFLRMMESRGDFIIHHEPTIPVYDRIHYAELTKDWFRKDAHKSFEEVKNNIYESQKRSHVFIKDMSFSAHDFVLADQSFIKNPSIYFIFLVRDPHASTISFYKKHSTIEKGMSDLIGLKLLFEMYETIKKVNPNGVKIIFSEELSEDPRGTMRGFCQHVGIPFTENAFSWKKHDADFKGHQEWHEQKVGDLLYHWHGRAILSEQMEAPSKYEVDEKGKPTFNEISNSEDRKSMLKIYHENLVFYKKFLKAKEDDLKE